MLLPEVAGGGDCKQWEVAVWHNNTESREWAQLDLERDGNEAEHVLTTTLPYRYGEAIDIS